jgi:hypothetical protein
MKRCINQYLHDISSNIHASQYSTPWSSSASRWVGCLPILDHSHSRQEGGGGWRPCHKRGLIATNSTLTSGNSDASRRAASRIILFFSSRLNSLVEKPCSFDGEIHHRSVEDDDTGVAGAAATSTSSTTERKAQNLPPGSVPESPVVLSPAESPAVIARWHNSLRV